MATPRTLRTRAIRSRRLARRRAAWGQSPFESLARVRQAIQARRGAMLPSARADLTQAVQPAVAAGGVLSAATYSLKMPVAPGMLVAIFGSGFTAAGQVYTASALPWPTTLGKTSVTIGGEPMPLYVVTPGQINAMIPYDAAVNTTLSLVVTYDGVASAGVAVIVEPAEPGIFALTQNERGTGIVEIVHADGTQALAGGNNVAKPGDVLVIYGTGLGAKTPAVTAGAAAPLNTLAWAKNPVSVTIGGVAAPNVAFYGAAPGWSGLDQINVTVPAGVAGSLNTPLVLTQNQQSSTPLATVPTGSANTFFVSGTVSGLTGGDPMVLKNSNGDTVTATKSGVFRRPSIWVDSRTVLGGKGSLRRGKHRRALASCAPFCRHEELRRAAPTETRSTALSSSCERRIPGCRNIIGARHAHA